MAKLATFFLQVFIPANVLLLSKPDKTIWGDPQCSFLAEGGSESWNTWNIHAVGYCSNLITRSSECFACANNEIDAFDTIYNDANSDTYTYRCDLPTCGAEIIRNCDKTVAQEKTAMPFGVCFYLGFGFWHKYGCCSDASSKYPGRVFFFEYDDEEISGCPLDSLLSIIILPETGTCGDYERLWHYASSSNYITPPFMFQVDASTLVCNDANTYDCGNLEVPDLDSTAESINFLKNPMIIGFVGAPILLCCCCCGFAMYLIYWTKIRPKKMRNQTFQANDNPTVTADNY
eukprot:187559_1